MNIYDDSNHEDDHYHDNFHKDDDHDDNSYEVSTQLRSWLLWKSGQKLEDKQVEALAALPADASFLQKLLVKHRRLIGDL